jgi:hypothetical protein
VLSGAAEELTIEVSMHSGLLISASHPFEKAGAYVTYASPIYARGIGYYYVLASKACAHHKYT